MLMLFTSYILSEQLHQRGVTLVYMNPFPRKVCLLSEFMSHQQL